MSSAGTEYKLTAQIYKRRLAEFAFIIESEATGSVFSQVFHDNSRVASNNNLSPSEDNRIPV